MTVSSTVTRVTYTGNGVTTAFATTFPFFDADEIEVIERVIASGAETLKALTTHYTVSGGNGTTGTVTAVGGAPSSFVQWVIRRKTARTQEIDYTPNDPFPAETHEQGLDRLKMNVQELGEENDRALKFPKTDSASLSTTMPSSVARSGKFLTFDDDGAPTISAGSADGLTVSPFMATVLDDGDAAAARATLGIGESDLDITGLTALTVPAANDEVPIYDLSALANRKITLASLFKAITALSAETAPATDDELPLYDASAGTADKITVANLLKAINGLSEDTTPDAANDFVLTYDASAGTAKKVKPSNLGIGAFSDFQQFTGSGTWTKPAGATWVFVEAWGGGGGGGRVDTEDTAAGGGGGAYVARLFRASTLGATVTVTIGSGGAGAASNGASGNNGGNTTFGAHLIAYGGANSNTSGGGTGSAIGGNTALEHQHWFGGRGGEGMSAGSPSTFGGGGGAGYLGAGGGASQFAGSGGNSNGGAGNPPGGGGSGSRNTAGGAGARGECRVYSW
jgi:hypothetical protein